MINDSATSAMSRSRSFSSSWTDSRPQPPRVATVKPVSKSLSEDDLLKASDNDNSLSSPQRVFTRLNVNDLSLLKKDNIIGELEKCLEELESEHGYAQRLGDVYEKVESERNQLLDELDMAFQDLQLYMQKQKQVEDEKSTIETDREELTRENDELQKENEYLKAVLSNRNEITSNRLQEENHQYAERIKELEVKNGQHLDEINELYEERQTLITSLLHLQSAEVEDVIRKTSRSSSVCSRESLDDLDTASNVRSLITQIKDGEVDKDAYIKTLKELQSENEELKEAFKRIRKERDTAEQEIDQIKEEKDAVDLSYTEKIREFQALQEDRNEKNLSLSKLNLEKRTLQRQYDHMRETNRTLTTKLNTIQKELDALRTKPPRERFLSQSSITSEKALEDEELSTTANSSISVDTWTGNDEGGDDNDQVSPLVSVPATNRAMSVRRENSTVRELGELLEKVKALETKNKELDAQNKELEEELKDSTNACIKISERYDTETETTKKLEETCETYKKEINELKVSTSAQYSDLVVEYDNVRNYNQQLQNTIDKIRAEKESIKSELNNYKSDVIEKIKENLDALEKERVSLLSEKETLEMTVKSKEESENELKAKCSKLLQQVDETNQKSKTTSEAEDVLQRKHDGLQKDYDRLLQKCRQLEQSATETAGLAEELKHLKEANELLLQRYRSLESDYDATLKASEEEKMKYNALLTKHEKKCEQYNIGCQQYDSLEADHKEACHNYDELVRENNKLCQQYDDLHRQHKQNCNKYEGMIKENKNLVEKVSKCKCSELSVSTKSHETIVKNLQNEKANILSEKHELLDKKSDLEKMIISLNEEINDLKGLSAASDSDLQRAVKDCDAYRTKYDHVCADYDKITKEKAHFALTVETLRDENKRLNDTLRKQRLVTSSSQDLTLQKLQDENENFHQQMDVLQTNLANAINENKRLLERINRSDENVAATIRGLKARKNELQLQVETLKHENEHLKKMPKTKEKRLKFGKHDKGDKAGAEVVVNESLRTAHARMAELQLENDEMRRKLQEYEGLLNEQHQALAHANDLAMQKNLEGSKMKRSLEKRMEKITKENNELRRIIFLLDDSNVNNSNNNNTTTTTTTATTTSKTNTPSTSSTTTTVDKPKKSSEHSVVNITFSTEGDTTNSTSADATTDKTRLISVSTVTNPPTTHEQCSRTPSVPESPRLATSRQLENDLSIQLKELMEVSNNMTPHLEEEQRSHSVESVAPPVPPPPPNYGTTTRRYRYYR